MNMEVTVCKMGKGERVGGHEREGQMWGYKGLCMWRMDTGTEGGNVPWDRQQAGQCCRLSGFFLNCRVVGLLLNWRGPHRHTCIYNYSTEGSKTIAKAFQKDLGLILVQCRRLLIPKVYSSHFSICNYTFPECRKHDIFINLDSVVSDSGLVEFC